MKASIAIRVVDVEFILQLELVDHIRQEAFLEMTQKDVSIAQKANTFTSR